MTDSRPSNRHYEVVIVGGGIHGAGAAQVLSAAGYRCLLVEQQDWGWATSSRSSKLLHGGLRYLQTGQLKLVRECLHERERLLRYAPSLARINWFYLPLYEDSQYPPWKIRAGLTLYRLLTGLANPHGQFREVPRSAWPTLDGLCTHNLRAVFAYQDAQTDDRLLTRAVVNSARSLGCETACPATLLGATRQHEGWRLDLNERSGLCSLDCRVIINAAGPWVNDIIRLCGGQQQLPIELVQGTHLVLQQAISPSCFYLEASDHRAVFVLPWHGQTLVGTTEVPFDSAPEFTQPTAQEVHYLLDTVRAHFPGANLDIASQFSGLRVLPASGERAFVRSRDTRILDEHGLISLYGGKLTAYRATALQLLPRVQQHLGVRPAIADTATLPLHHPDRAD